jgi:hypothetical protein
MSTLRVNTLQNVAGTGDPSINGAAKAWVNFNGTGTVAIRAAFNVSSITDNGTGDYTVNFTTAVPDVNYATCVNSTRDIGYPIPLINSQATGSVRINTTQFNSSIATPIDTTITNVAIFR